MNQIEELLKRVLTSLLVDMVISGARGGGDFIKIKVRPVMIRDSLYFQVSRYTDKQVFHENMTAEDALETTVHQFPILPFCHRWQQDLTTLTT